MWLPFIRANKTATKPADPPRRSSMQRGGCRMTIHGMGIGIGLLFAGLSAFQIAAADEAAQLPPDYSPKHANFQQEPTSRAAMHIADWVVDSGDNQGMPFVIVDKTGAKVFVFHANGLLRGAAPALLGLAMGDESVAGIGDRELSAIRPLERTTPAGRFVASLDRNSRGKGILWVDYDSAVSLHPVLTSNLRERRLERLTTPTPLDNRISYGCINVPAKFYSDVVNPAFAGTNGIVYVLPEVRGTREIFPSYYDVL